MARLTTRKQRDLSNYFSPELSPYDTTKLDKSIENALMRIQSTSFPIETDKRNIIEKSLNLPEGQNALLDVLELIGRPGEAVKGGLATGTLQGSAEGLAGTRRTSGTDVLESFGVELPENKYARGALGFGVNVITDPTMLLPGGALVKGAKIGLGVAGKGASMLPGASKLAEATQPLRTGAKETFSSLFNPRHGRNLQVDEMGNVIKGDDLLTPLIQQRQADIQFDLTKSQKDISEAAKLAGGFKSGEDVGRVMEQNLSNIDFTAPEGVEQAAKLLTDSNDALRETAKDFGISIGEIDGYMRHIFTKEEKARRKTMGQSVFEGKDVQGKFLQSREIEGTALEINEKMKRKFFETNALLATAQGQEQLIKFMHGSRFMKNVLGDSRIATKFEEGVTKVPDGFTKIRAQDYAPTKMFDEMQGEYIVPNALKTDLKNYKRAISDEGTNKFAKAFDKVQNLWKGGVLFSGGYHARNVMGNWWNNWVGGMGATDLPKYNAIALKEVQKARSGTASPEFDEFLRQGLTQGSQASSELGEAAIEKRLTRDIKLKGGTPLERVVAGFKNPFQLSRDVGGYMDEIARYAGYKWATDKGKNPQEAADFVRKTQFDYNELTTFEREFMARVMPFYRWTRKNLPFQVQQFANDPRKFMLADKFRQEMHEVADIPEEMTPDYLKEQFAIPISGEDGKGKILSLNLPIGDMAKWGENPLKEAMSAITPLAKLPLELQQNRDFFRQRPIQKFEGQKIEFQMPFTEEKFKAEPKLVHVIRQLGGQLPKAAMDTLMQDETEESFKALDKTLGISNIFKDFDIEKEEFFKKKNELRKLYDYMNVIEQSTGERPPTLAEISKQLQSGQFK